MSDSASPQAPAAGRSLARSLVWTAGMFLAHFVALIVLVVVLGWAVPHFVRMYEEFDAELPVLTEWVFRLSNFVVVWWHLILPFGAGVDGAILLGLSLLPDKAKWLGTLWAVLVLLAAILLLGLIIVAVSMPLMGSFHGLT